MAPDRQDEEEYSVIGDKGEIGFIDYEDDRSVCSYNPNEEGPVVISVPFPLVDKPHSVVVNETASDSITIRNTTEDPIDIWGVNIYASNPEDSFFLSLRKPPPDTEPRDDFVGSFSIEDRVLQPRQTLTLWLFCKPVEIGLHTSVVHFKVGDDTIERVVFLMAEDKVSEALASQKPYHRNENRNSFRTHTYHMGVRPDRPTTSRPRKFRLPRYDIPQDMREAIESKQFPEVISEGLSINNYVSYFRTLLIMEELRMEEDMRNYDMQCVPLKKKGPYLALEVPGLAEKRPSIVHGDYICLKLSADDGDEKPPFQGCVHRVEADEVYLKFSPDFHRNYMNENLYNVSFTYSRFNMRRLYQAIEAAEGLQMEFLFPYEYSVSRLINSRTMVPISSSLNEEQMNAIEIILRCKGGAPYVIHGPPGTGKTKTLVELILQLYRRRNGCRILVCASSNYAADHILEKIVGEENVEVRDNKIFRLNAPSRPYEDVRSDHIKFCYFDDLVFKCPPCKALLRYRILITTYISASLLYQEGLKRGHFSHIILDEAGQASEPETMVPISHFKQKETVVVLAGDPMQLGPVIHSRDAQKFGLGRSFLERLFECEPYSAQHEDYVTTLVKSYRCKPEILHLPSEMFYQGRLRACMEEKDTAMSWANLLPNKEFPLLFIGVQGCDEREGNNPSWFNRIEASKVAEIVRKLLARNIDEEDIGVITPYRQQVAKIKLALERMESFDIKIGSVEQFQGQEKKVIIVSTVRSTIKHNEFDKTFCLGFLRNPRRFNVAMTRAQSLLVIIGNPHIICKDQHWDRILWYCVDNNSYQGCLLPERPFHDNVNHNSYQSPVKQGVFGSQETKERENVCVPAEVTFTAKDEDEWSDGWKDGAKDEQEWSDGWKTTAPMDENKWSDGWKSNAMDEQEWSDGWKTTAPMDENKWSDGWKSNAMDENEWSDGWKTTVAKDEDEWSDGWK